METPDISAVQGHGKFLSRFGGCPDDGDYRVSLWYYSCQYYMIDERCGVVESLPLPFIHLMGQVYEAVSEHEDYKEDTP
jgi:hypothetical protein